MSPLHDHAEKGAVPGFGDGNSSVVGEFFEGTIEVVGRALAGQS